MKSFPSGAFLKLLLHPSSVATALAIACAAPLAAGTLFEETFETPDISGYEQGVTPPDIWVRAASGYGSGDHGMVDKDSSDFSAPAGNDQAYSMIYTNSGITTAEGVLGPPLAAGASYQVSFDVVKNGATGGRGYTVRLIAFADGALRNDCRSTPTGSFVLASATGNSPDDGSFATVTFNFTAGTTNLGKDLAIRVIGSSGSAIIDNIIFRTIPNANPGVNLVTSTPQDNETKALTYVPLLAVFDKNIVAGSGDITLRNLTNAIDTVIPVNDPRVNISGTLLQIQTDDLLEWGKNYAVLIAGTAIDDIGGNSYSGIANETTWNFSTAVGDPLLYSVARLKDHILGNITLSAAEIDAIKLDLDVVAPRFAESADTITALLDLIETYDTELGALWIARGLPKRDAVTNDLHWTIFNVMQNIMDRIYRSGTLAAHEELLDGFKFVSSSNFPGACAPPANPANVHTSTISASYLKTFGKATLGDGPFTFARKPTGTYLAPGTIATVTVPLSMVNTGYRIRVGANSPDFKAKPDIKRLDRVTRTYEITSLETKIANPLGGGIYIEVPFLANAGVVSVDITGAVRSPYFSAKSFHTTTASEWLTERNHPGPWADFQTDKFMMQVPKTWISAMTGEQAVQLMTDWDKSLDAINDLMGYPRIRGKESMYPQVDLLLKNSVYAPGYPSINTTYSPTGSYGGYAGSHLVRGPQNAPYYEFHELGHAYFFPKFAGESESNVNLLHVAVMNRAFGKSLDEGHRTSLGGNSFTTLDTTAMAWMCVFNFSPREVPMATDEKAYQFKGHAKFVDIAKLYGWEALDEYWYEMMVATENNTSFSTTTDALLLRLCKATGTDIRPLFHFWGIHPQNPASLAASIAAVVPPILPDLAIKDRLLHYKSLIPANNAEFRTFTTGWWGKKPSITGYWEQREHARQWDQEALFGAGDHQRADITVNEEYIEACADQIRGRIDELVELYFPSVLGPNPMFFAVAPAAMNATTIAMTATTATAPAGNIEYYFENFTNGNNSGWISGKAWSNTGLTAGQNYQFRVKARDATLTETAWSALSSATPADDTTPPSPGTLSFASPPVALDISSITMTSTVATDINGVEYYFQCTAGGGPDSEWQTSPEYTATGLEPGTEYTFVVRARDSYGNTTTNSAPASATTLVPDTTSPLATLYTPSHQAGNISIGTNLVLIFDENIAIGSGNVTIRNLTDGPSGDIIIAITDGSQVTVSGAILTINPTANLLDGTNYAVRIDGTAIDDISGNSYAGINSDTTWTFTTEVLPYVWTQTTGGAQAWTTGANWLSGSAPDPVAGDTLDFSTVNIAADTNLTLGGDRTAALWKFGDTSGSNNWTVNNANQMILAGTTPTIEVKQNTTTLNNVVAGTGGLRKTGAGTLALAGANNFTGGITLSNGELRANATGMGGNVVTFSGTSGTLAALAKITQSVSVVVPDGAMGTIRTDFNNQPTITQGISGSGTLRLASTGGSAGTMTLNSTSNTFTGILELNAPANLTVNMSSLGDGSGSIRYLGGATTTFNLSLTAPLSSRGLELAGAGSAIFNNNSGGTTNIVTFGSDLLVSAAGNKTLTLGGGNAGENAFNGLITNGSGTISLVKSGGGKWILSGGNTYTGATTISQGTLSIHSIGNVGGGSSALGNPGSAANGLILMGGGNNTGTLLYTGPGHNSDRTIQVNSSDNTNTGGAAIVNDGEGPLAFTAPIFNNSYTLAQTITRTLTLSGTHGGTIQGVVRDNSATGKVAMTKSGGGTWVLSGPNTYTGATAVSGGKLDINGDQTPANGNVSVSANATLGGTGIIGGNTTIAASGRLEFALVTNAANHDKLELAVGRTFIFSGASALTIISSGGASPGDYILVTAPGGFGSSVPPASVNLPAGWLADAPRIVDTNLMINITSTGVVSSPYETWSGGAPFDGDANGDGVANGLAWLLGAAKPDANANGLLPAVSQNFGNLVLTFRCLNAANRGGALLNVQYSSNLGASDPWASAAVPEISVTVSGVNFTIAPDGDYNDVIATIPVGEGASGKLFGRLLATE